MDKNQLPRQRNLLCQWATGHAERYENTLCVACGVSWPFSVDAIRCQKWNHNAFSHVHLTCGYMYIIFSITVWLCFLPNVTDLKVSKAWRHNLSDRLSDSLGKRIIRLCIYDHAGDLSYCFTFQLPPIYGWPKWNSIIQYAFYEWERVFDTRSRRHTSYTFLHN